MWMFQHTNEVFLEGRETIARYGTLRKHRKIGSDEFQSATHRAASGISVLTILLNAAVHHTPQLLTKGSTLPAAEREYTSGKLQRQTICEYVINQN